MRWRIAEATHWTLEYIDALSFEDIWHWISVHDGTNKAANSLVRKS